MDFVIIANAWSAARDNPTSKHQIARALCDLGHRVLWLEGAGMRRPRFGSGADRGRMRRKLGAACRGARRATDAPGELWVLAPLLIPLPARRSVRAFNGWWFRQGARFWARRLGFREPVLINYVPVLAGAMRRWPGRVVYHCVDRWDRFDMYDAEVMARMDADCRAHADLVVVSSRALYDHCRREHARVTRIDHGVNHDHFAAPLREACARPADLPEGPIVGFFGLLSEWVDQDLLIAVAQRRPDARIVLIGKADVPVERLRRVANIHLLGPRPFARLPAYVARFDVGLIPFVVNELTRAVNPIKLREMLAAGCRVVSTALPEVEAYAGEARGVAIAANGADFVEAVAHALDTPFGTAERRALSATMASETWLAKTEQLVECIEAVTWPAAHPARQSGNQTGPRTNTNEHE